MRSLLVGIALVAAAGILSMFGNTAAQSARPYAGLQARAVKALSAEQIADLKVGRGMSLALAAELNGYPGPRLRRRGLGDASTGLTIERRGCWT